MGAVDEYLEGKNAHGEALFREFHRLVDACGPSEPSVSKTVVYFRRNRIFAGAFVRGRALEIVIDLLRPVEHARSIGSFASTKRVVTNRLRIRETEELDDSILALLREAYDEVGPGTRPR